MAQIGIHVSTKHGSHTTVSRMIDDTCLGFETTVYLHAKGVPEPHIYSKDSVTIHGDPAAIRLLLEKCLAALDYKTSEVGA